MCCPTSDGGAAAIICSEEFVRKHNLQNQAIEIVGMATATDTPRLYEQQSMIELTGSDMTRISAKKALSEAGITINDVKVIECARPLPIATSKALGLTIHRCHDCFAAN
jgi:sterol carrier protein 2